MVSEASPFAIDNFWLMAFGLLHMALSAYPSLLLIFTQVETIFWRYPQFLLKRGLVLKIDISTTESLLCAGITWQELGNYFGTMGLMMSKKVTTVREWICSQIKKIFSRQQLLHCSCSNPALLLISHGSTPVPLSQLEYYGSMNIMGAWISW